MKPARSAALFSLLVLTLSGAGWCGMTDLQLASLTGEVNTAEKSLCAFFAAGDWEKANGRYDALVSRRALMSWTRDTRQAEALRHLFFPADNALNLKLRNYVYVRRIFTAHRLDPSELNGTYRASYIPAAVRNLGALCGVRADGDKLTADLRAGFDARIGALLQARADARGRGRMEKARELARREAGKLGAASSGFPADLDPRILDADAFRAVMSGRCDQDLRRRIHRMTAVYGGWTPSARRNAREFGLNDDEGGPAPLRVLERLRAYDAACAEKRNLQQKTSDPNALVALIAPRFERLRALYAGSKNIFYRTQRIPSEKELARSVYKNLALDFNENPRSPYRAGAFGEIVWNAQSSYPFRAFLQAKAWSERRAWADQLARRIGERTGVPDAAVREMLLDHPDLASLEWNAGRGAFALSFRGGRGPESAVLTTATRRESDPRQAALRILHEGRSSVKAWDEYLADGGRLDFRCSIEFPEGKTFVTYKVIRKTRDFAGKWETAEAIFQRRQDETDPGTSVLRQLQKHPNIVLVVLGGIGGALRTYVQTMQIAGHRAAYGAALAFGTQDADFNADHLLHDLADTLAQSGYKPGADMSGAVGLLDSYLGPRDSAARARLDRFVLNEWRCDSRLDALLARAGEIKGTSALYKEYCGRGPDGKLLRPITDAERLEYLLGGQRYGLGGMQRQVVIMTASDGLTLTTGASVLLAFGPEIMGNYVLVSKAVSLMNVLGTLTVVTRGGAQTIALSKAGQAIFAGGALIPTAPQWGGDLRKVVGMLQTSVLDAWSGQKRVYTRREREENVSAVIGTIQMLPAVTAVKGLLPGGALRVPPGALGSMMEDVIADASRRGEGGMFGPGLEPALRRYIGARLADNPSAAAELWKSFGGRVGPMPAELARAARAHAAAPAARPGSVWSRLAELRLGRYIRDIRRFQSAAPGTPKESILRTYFQRVSDLSARHKADLWRYFTGEATDPGDWIETRAAPSSSGRATPVLASRGSALPVAVSAPVGALAARVNLSLVPVVPMFHAGPPLAPVARTNREWNELVRRRSAISPAVKMRGLADSLLAWGMESSPPELIIGLGAQLGLTPAQSLEAQRGALASKSRARIKPKEEEQPVSNEPPDLGPAQLARERRRIRAEMEELRKKGETDPRARADYEYLLREIGDNPSDAVVQRIGKAHNYGELALEPRTTSSRRTGKTRTTRYSQSDNMKKGSILLRPDAAGDPGLTPRAAGILADNGFVGLGSTDPGYKEIGRARDIVRLSEVGDHLFAVAGMEAETTSVAERLNSPLQLLGRKKYQVALSRISRLQEIILSARGAIPPSLDHNDAIYGYIDYIDVGQNIWRVLGGDSNEVRRKLEVLSVHFDRLFARINEDLFQDRGLLKAAGADAALDQDIAKSANLFDTLFKSVEASVSAEIARQGGPGGLIGTLQIQARSLSQLENESHDGRFIPRLPRSNEMEGPLQGFLLDPRALAVLQWRRNLLGWMQAAGRARENGTLADINNVVEAIDPRNSWNQGILSLEEMAAVQGMQAKLDGLDREFAAACGSVNGQLGDPREFKVSLARLRAEAIRFASASGVFLEVATRRQNAIDRLGAHDQLFLVSPLRPDVNAMGFHSAAQMIMYQRVKSVQSFIYAARSPGGVVERIERGLETLKRVHRLDVSIYEQELRDCSAEADAVAGRVRNVGEDLGLDVLQAKLERLHHDVQQALGNPRAARVPNPISAPSQNEVVSDLSEHTITVVGAVGAGAMGVVYRVRTRNQTIKIAKTIAPGSPEEVRDNAKALKAESGLLRKLRGDPQDPSSQPDPGVPRWINYFEVHEHPYLLMEDVPGKNLKACIKGLSQEKAVQYAGQILDVLESLHQEHILHLDLKPDNIIIRQMPSGADHAVLIDFGIAAEYTPGYREKEPQGTPPYCAPEQYHGTPDYRSDLYSLGVILREMLIGTGEPEPTDPAAGRAYRQKVARVDPGLWAIVKKLTAPDPDDRYPNTMAVRKALRTWSMRQALKPPSP